MFIGEIERNLLNPIEVSAIDKKRTVPNSSLTKPSGFSPTVPFTITHNNGTFTTNLDITSYKITPTNTYYVSTTGSNANDGLTLGNAKADIDGAIAAGNAAAAPYEILVQGGTYNRNKDWSTTPTQDCNIIGENGTVILSSQEDGLSFTADSGAYKATRSAVGSVYDTDFTDSNGDYERLTLAASAADCRATAGTWYTDNVEVWVHTTDERDLSSDATALRVYLKVNPPKVNADVTVYIENLNIEGFQTANAEITNSAVSQDLQFYANSCSFKYCIDGNALVCNGCAITIFKDCVVSYGYLDGFNYHSKNGTVPIAYEVDCTSRNCGQSSSDSNNASTMHDGGSILRINGTYILSEGRNIHDIGSGTESWNINCLSAQSRSATLTGSINWFCGDTNAATMWLVNCISIGSIVDWKVDTADTLYINDQLIESVGVTNGTVSLFNQE